VTLESAGERNIRYSRACGSAEDDGPNPTDATAPQLMWEKHVGIPELSSRWRYSEDVIRRWFLEKPRPGVLRHSVHKRGKREYVSLRISESAAAAVYAEKCGCEQR
jgi:hypothetical protein